MEQQQQQAQAQQPEACVEGFNAKSERTSGIYLSVFDGSICQKSKTPVDGWEGPIKTQNPQTKEDVLTYCYRYDSVVARIIDVQKYQKTFDSGGKSSGFNITLLAGDKKATLQLTWIEPTLKRFLKVARNIDFTKPVRISVFPITKPSGKKSSAVSFKQGDGPDPQQWEKVEEFYNAQSEDMPQPTQDDMDGSWDYKPQERFLGVRFAEDVLPKIKEIAAQYPQYIEKRESPGNAQQQAQGQKPAGQQQQQPQASKQEFAQARANFAQSQNQLPQAQPPVSANGPQEPEGLMDRGQTNDGPPDDDDSDIPF